MVKHSNITKKVNDEALISLDNMQLAAKQRHPFSMKKKSKSFLPVILYKNQILLLNFRNANDLNFKLSTGELFCYYSSHYTLMTQCRIKVNHNFHLACNLDHKQFRLFIHVLTEPRNKHFTKGNRLSIITMAGAQTNLIMVQKEHV
jgi:hypothetical protein